jgi:hypothetical protein
VLANWEHQIFQPENSAAILPLNAVCLARLNPAVVSIPVKASGVGN